MKVRGKPVLCGNPPRCPLNSTASGCAGRSSRQPAHVDLNDLGPFRSHASAGIRNSPGIETVFNASTLCSLRPQRHICGARIRHPTRLPVTVDAAPAGNLPSRQIEFHSRHHRPSRGGSWYRHARKAARYAGNVAPSFFAIHSNRGPRRDLSYRHQWRPVNSTRSNRPSRKTTTFRHLGPNASDKSINGNPTPLTLEIGINRNACQHRSLIANAAKWNQLTSSQFRALSSDHAPLTGFFKM